jgi:hypothetical protein
MKPCEIPKEILKDVKCTYDVILRRVRLTIVAVEM